MLGISRDNIRRTVRTFVIATLGLFIPGALGWLNDFTSWASSNGQKPFPDMHSLEYLALAAIGGGCIAIFNLLWNAVEDQTGKGMLRTPQEPKAPNG